jgi:hypothetical protein
MGSVITDCGGLNALADSVSLQKETSKKPAFYGAVEIIVRKCIGELECNKKVLKMDTLDIILHGGGTVSFRFQRQASQFESVNNPR